MSFPRGDSGFWPCQPLIISLFSGFQNDALVHLCGPPSQGDVCSCSHSWVAAAAKSLQSCPTLCNPIDGSPPGFPVHGILQARTLEWVAISFSNAWKWNVKVKSLSRIRLLATPWTAAHQAPPSMGFSRQEYWSGVPLPSPSLLGIPGYFLNSLENSWISSCSSSVGHVLHPMFSSLPRNEA